ncbi:MAG TPA: protein kinase [Vicinamibacterales bacterium]|jgi:serine/threonine-protein kinase|nr:protein kinase [Vicinamibacterales bacterium]
MTPERWREITDAFQAALARDTVSREAFLDERCRGDADLRAEVATLLAAHVDASALDRPIAGVPVVVGTRIGPYRLDALVGEGGMGQVFRARDTTLGRDVAIKVLPAALMADPQRHARFAREARLLAALNHPHIAHVYGFEERDGIRALVMELVDGPTLADLIARARLPMMRTLALARQIAQALDAAHDKGIVHRDLKPANIKVTPTDDVKVLDFGLAKALVPDGAESDAASSPTVTAQATEIGTILGTAAYMAPEQASGRPVDKRADIWAFGVVLFEMLTGRRLFAGETVNETLAAVLRQEIDWTQLPADTPSGVQRLLRRCLERDRQTRLRDIGDALVELDASTESTAAIATPPARRRLSLVLPWAVAAVAILAAGALMWTRTHESHSSASVVRFTSVIQGVARHVAVSRDGTQIAYSHSGPDGTWLMRRRLDELGSQRIDGSENATMPVFSPDGQWIAYTGPDLRHIFKIPIAGGTPIPLCDGNFYGGVTWTDDGYLIFGNSPRVGDIPGLRRVPASGGTAEVLTKVAEDEVVHLTPQVLPGGRQILFTVVKGGGQPDVAVLDLATKQYHPIAKGGVGSRYIDGYLTYVWEKTLFVAPFDAQRLALTGDAVSIVSDIFQPLQVLADYAISDSGLLAYRADDVEGTTLTWADRRGVTHAIAGQAHEAWAGFARVSPDGRRIVSGIFQDSQGDVSVMDADRGALTKLTFEGQNGHPVWDGQSIIYWSRRTAPGVPGIYRVPADGSGQSTLVFATTIEMDPTSISPSGDTLLVERLDPTGSNPIVDQLFAIPLKADGTSAGDPRPLHEAHANEYDAEISPDGRTVAYVSTESGARNVYVRPFPGPGPTMRVSSNVGTAPRWSRDGRTLYYRANDTLMSVAMVPGSAEPGAIHELFRMPAGETWDVTPDVDRFLVEVPDKAPSASTSTFVVATNWLDELRQRMPPKP